MSEVKRPKLISFGSQRVNDKNTKEHGKTARITVVLPESTEDKCPEFNYKDLCIAAKKKQATQTHSSSKQTNGLDPFNEDDEDVKRIAAEMEAKYGMGVAKKRKWRKDDYADIGMGYDESDSFIDNTDGYDEIIPKNVTTLHGGFYINCGALEFKTDEDVSTEDSSSSDEDTPEKAVNRKRILESSPESEEEVQTDKPDISQQHLEKKPKLVNTNGMQKAIKKRLFSTDKIKQQISNQRADETKKTVRELLKEKREDLNMSVLNDTIIPESPAAEPVTVLKENPKQMATVVDIIESVISGVNKKVEVIDDSSKDSASSKDGLHKSAFNSSEADSNDDVQSKPIEIVQLPENLPADIVGIIDSIKKAAANNTEGKVKFFSGHVNTILYNLERKCRCLGKQSRMKVYEHLAPFVKCRKETLIKRAKKLCAVEEQKKIKVLLDRLKSVVGAVMPSLIATYEADCQAILQRKFCVQNEEATKNFRMPKRHFIWTDEMRKLVKDIITLMRKCYINEGKQKESLEKHLSEFVKTEVHTIWPDGWVSMNTLLKYCTFSPEAKKNLDAAIKPPPKSSPDLSISPTAPTISPCPNTIPISSTSALTITPVTPAVHKVSTTEIKVKPKSIALNNEMIISKVNNDTSISKTSSTKPLPSVDIIKSIATDVNNTKYHTSSINNCNKVLYSKDEMMIIEDCKSVKEEPENLSSHKQHEFLQNSNNHCQIIDLTDGPELRRKPGPKSKTKKYLYDYSDKPPKLKKEVKSKEEITGSSALTQIIADSLSDPSRFSQSVSSFNNASDPIGKKLCSSFDYTKPRLHTEGDDIQKVMEGLKVLQKMSSPVKNDEVKTSAPVSVIAFNKSYSHDSNNSSPNTSITAHNRSNSFQDAFQKQFIPDYHLMKTSHTTSNKGNLTSVPKHNHLSTKSNSTTSDRHIQNSNNNYAQQNSNKIKNSCTSQQSGSYNMLDDMFANFLSEYGHSKTANTNTQPK